MCSLRDLLYFALRLGNHLYLPKARFSFLTQRAAKVSLQV
jgi:hypothetical protein